MSSFQKFFLLLVAVTYSFQGTIAVGGDECSNGTISTPIGCLPIRQLDLDCQYTLQCTSGKPGPFSQCHKSVCKCADNATPIDQTCHPSYKNPQYCDLNEQCGKLGPLGVCATGKQCVCSKDSVYNQLTDKCDPVPKSPGNVLYGQRCRNLSDCMGDPFVSECFGRCSCKPGFTPSSNLSQCLKIVDKFGEPCQESQQCQKGRLGGRSACIESKCDCGDDGVFEVTEETCISTKNALGDRCTIDLECIVELDHAVCLNGRCACMSGARVKNAKCISLA